MRQSVFSRAIALSIALAVIGGVATPALDALIYHRGIEHEAGAHWEPAGGCQGHTDHCQLGATAAGPGVVAPRLAPIASTPEPVAVLESHRPDAFPPDATTPLHRSRAPPALEG